MHREARAQLQSWCWRVLAVVCAAAVCGTALPWQCGACLQHGGLTAQCHLARQKQTEGAPC